MKLVPINIKSIYNNGGPLPMPMAQMTEDAAASLIEVRAEIEAKGGLFRVSDMFRTHNQQVQAHNDFVTGRKKAYSPPAGGSMHEAGRAIDLDLAVLINGPSVPHGYHVFSWDEIKEIFIRNGWTPIAPGGDQHSVDIKEKWHFDFRGKFDATYKQALARSGKHGFAYHAMAAAAIADLDIYQHLAPATGNVAAQPKLIRLGYLTEAQAKGGDGPLTRAAISTFQTDHHLTPTGSAGTDTHAGLDHAIAALPK